METPKIRGDGSDVAMFETTEKKIILRWDSTTSEEAKENLIFQSDREEVDRYLKAVDEVQRHISSVSVSDEVKAASSTIQIAMARLEDELRNILISQTSSFEPDSLLLDSSLSSSSFASSSRTDIEDDNSGIACNSNEEEQQQPLDLVLPDGSGSDLVLQFVSIREEN